MAEQFKVGQEIQLKGKDNNPLEEIYYVHELTNKLVIKVRDKNNVIARVFRSRVLPAKASRLDQHGARRASSQEPKSQGKKETVMTTAVAPEKDKKEAKVTKAAVKVEKPKKIKKVPAPFNIEAWVKENGGDHPLHYRKIKEKFSKEHDLHTHVLINKDKNVYLCLNLYTYQASDQYPEFPTGYVSKGKKDTGGNQFALKGKTINIKVKDKNTGQVITRPQKGSKTVEQLVKELTSGNDPYKAITP
jgi:hypothetical protein